MLVRHQPVSALIFDMDGTMIDSMPYHTQSWIAFAKRHQLVVDVPDLLRRTTGRTGAECMAELFGRPVPHDEALGLIAEKESLYRALFAPVFREVPGFTAFAGLALRAGLKVGIGTAGDRHNVGFALSHLKLPFTPQAIVGGDEGFPGKPEPAIFLEASRRLAVAPEACIVFEDAPFGIEAARRAGMQAVALCTSHPATELAGPHVLRAVPDFNALLTTGFLEKLNVDAS